MQECAAGLLPVQVAGEGAARRVSVRAPHGRVKPLRTRPDALLEAALAGTVRGDLPPALVDNGPAWWVVSLADAHQVRAMAPRLHEIAALTEATGAVGLAVFGAAHGTDHALAVRAFCPADGIPEDPVTGSANAAIAAWLHQNQALSTVGNPYIASQGREIGRDGRVEVRVDAEGEVWIGGRTQTVIRGSLDW